MLSDRQFLAKELFKAACIPFSSILPKQCLAGLWQVKGGDAVG